MAAEFVRTGYGPSEPVQGVRRFPDKDQDKMGSEREASDHTGGSGRTRAQAALKSGNPRW